MFVFFMKFITDYGMHLPRKDLFMSLFIIYDEVYL